MAKGLKHYKQSRYKVRRKPVNRLLIFVIAAALVILALSILLGRYLGGLVKDTPTDTSAAETEKETEAPMPHVSVPSLGYAPFSTAELCDREHARAELSRVKSKGAFGVCVWLLGENGAPAYGSEIYASVYSGSADGVRISDFCSEAKALGLRVCGLFPLLRSGRDEAGRESFELTLLREIAAAGIDEVLMLPESGNGTEMGTYLRKAKAVCPGVAFGISADAQALIDDPYLAARLSQIYDYTAADLRGMTIEPEEVPTDVTTTDTPEAESDTVSETTPPSPAANAVKALSLTAERYGMRYLLSQSELDRISHIPEISDGDSPLILIPSPEKPEAEESR